MAESLTVAPGIGWGMKTAGWITSPIISELFKKASPYLGFDTSKKLKELETKILLLEWVMEAVEERALTGIVSNSCLRILNLLYTKLKKILDDVEYHHLKKQIKDNKMKPDRDASPRKRDWMKKKLQFFKPSFPLKE